MDYDPGTLIEAQKLRIRQLEAESQIQKILLSRFKVALTQVLETGLNGGNNVRLAYIAASRGPLDQATLDKAQDSEVAVQQARQLIEDYDRGN